MAAGQRLREPLLLRQPEDDLADEEEHHIVPAVECSHSSARTSPLAGATGGGCLEDASPSCFSIFSEARRYTQQHMSALSRAAGDGYREALMFPAMVRWGSVTSINLRAFDMSLGAEDVGSASRYSNPGRANVGRAWMGARLFHALKEAARGVRFPYRVAAALGLQQEGENYKTYYSRRHRQSARGGEGLVVCLPMCISEISSNGRTRERTDLNQLDLLRECLSRIKRPTAQLAAILRPSEFTHLSCLNPGPGKDMIGHADVDSGASSGARAKKDVFFRLTPLELPTVRQRGASADGSTRTGHACIEDEQQDVQRLGLGDFRALQPLGDAEVLVREGAVVVGLDPVRAVITTSRLYVVVPPGDDKVLQQLQNRLWKAGAFQDFPEEGRESAASTRPTWAGIGPGVGQGHTFQEVALGAVLATVLDFYVEQVRVLAYTSVSVWNSVRRRVSSAEMNKLLLLRVRMEDMLRQVEGVHLVMETLHDQVDPQHAHALGGFKLEDAGHNCRAAGDGVGVREVAWLLEEHMGEIVVLRAYLKNILEELEDMRVLLQFQLLCSQNKLLRAEVGFQTVTAWICAGCLVGGVFGMNFHNGFESSHAGPVASAAAVEALQASAGGGWLARVTVENHTAAAPGHANENMTVGEGGFEGIGTEGSSHVVVSWIWLQVVVGTTLGDRRGAWCLVARFSTVSRAQPVGVCKSCQERGVRGEARQHFGLSQVCKGPACLLSDANSMLVSAGRDYSGGFPDVCNAIPARSLSQVTARPFY